MQKFRSNPIALDSKNQRGFGLIETLIAASIIGILCLGMGSVAVNMSKTQEAASLLSTLNSLSANMQKDILDANAWRNTISLSGGSTNGAFNCIRTNTACTATSPYPATSGNELTTYRIFNTLADGVGLTGGTYYTDNGTNGYTYAGQACTGYVLDMNSAGNDLCPISYRLRSVFLCPGFLTSCIAPAVIIFAYLQYHPGAHGATFMVNTTRYNVMVSRTAGAVNRNDNIRIEDETTGAAPLTNGPCSTAGVYRKFKTTPTLDTAGNVTNISAAGLVSLKAGGYTCNALATGYGVGNFNLTLYIGYGSSVPLPVATSLFAQAAPPTGLQQVRIPDYSINSAVDFTLQLKQTCQYPGTLPHAFG